MPQIVKSVLFFDYDSICNSLRSRHPEVGDNFALRASAWIAGIESGDLISSPTNEGRRRRLLVKRCYADPKLLGANRSPLISSGIQIVDCPSQEGWSRNSADISMALDTIDALEHATGFEEFILLSAASDLSPVLFRLRAHNRGSVVYSDASTSASYLTFSDGAVPEARLAAMLVPPGARTARAAAEARQSPQPPSPVPTEDDLADEAPSEPLRQDSTAVSRSSGVRPTAETDEGAAAGESSGSGKARGGGRSASQQGYGAGRVPEQTGRAVVTDAAARRAMANLNGGGRPDEADQNRNTEVAESHSRDSQREELAALVRRMHQATRVPLFSPRSFADLFRILAAEVARNGYRFPATAESVTNEMIALGRNVTRRQVGFVVKGLALKGHNFSGEDTAERLAILFREQVIYLARNANLNLTDRETSLVTAWIVGRSTLDDEPKALPQARIESPAKAASPPIQAQPQATAKPAPSGGGTSRPVESSSASPAPATAEGRSEKRPLRPLRPKLAEVPKAPRIILPEEPQPEAFRPVEPMPAPPAVARRPIVKPPARIASPTPPPAPPVATEPHVPTEAPVSAAPSPREPEVDLPDDDMESLLLAAIAQAVEVDAAPASDEFHFDLDAEPSPSRRAEEEIDADIGDEIQRILATYGQSRPGRG